MLLRGWSELLLKFVCLAIAVVGDSFCVLAVLTTSVGAIEGWCSATIEAFAFWLGLGCMCALHLTLTGGCSAQLVIMCISA
jgi:hypothetical protein